MKIAIVSGGSRGLGKSIALHIAAKGTEVVLTYNSKKADAEGVVKQIDQTGRKAAALALDVSDSKSFDDFVGKLKEVLQAEWKRGLRLPDEQCRHRHLRPVCGNQRKAI
jgi:NAD(P)-dependent dehydrogenase (short-subunit alcohol dehydrogenase family)